MVGINVWVVTVYVGNTEYLCLYNELFMFSVYMFLKFGEVLNKALHDFK